MLPVHCPAAVLHRKRARAPPSAALRATTPGDETRTGLPPHKRLLKEMPVSLSFGFCESLSDHGPIGKGLRQILCGKNYCAKLSEHVLGFTPSTPAPHPIRSPRGKSFSPFRS